MVRTSNHTYNTRRALAADSLNLTDSVLPSHLSPQPAQPGPTSTPTFLRTDMVDSHLPIYYNHHLDHSFQSCSYISPLIQHRHSPHAERLIRQAG